MLWGNWEEGKEGRFNRKEEVEKGWGGWGSGVFKVPEGIGRHQGRVGIERTNGRAGRTGYRGRAADMRRGRQVRRENRREDDIHTGSYNWGMANLLAVSGRIRLMQFGTKKEWMRYPWMWISFLSRGEELNPIEAIPVREMAIRLPVSGKEGGLHRKVSSTSLRVEVGVKP